MYPTRILNMQVTTPLRRPMPVRATNTLPFRPLLTISRKKSTAVCLNFALPRTAYIARTLCKDRIDYRS